MLPAYEIKPQPQKVLLLFFVPKGAEFAPTSELLAAVCASYDAVASFTSHPVVKGREGTWLVRETFLIP